MKKTKLIDYGIPDIFENVTLKNGVVLLAISTLFKMINDDWVPSKDPKIKLIIPIIKMIK